MIDVNNLIQKHLYITKDEEQDVHTSQESVKELLKDFGIQLLKEAADKAKINSQYFSDEDCGITKVREILRTHDLCSERTDRDGDLYGVDTYEIDKSSITSIINDINFD